MGIKYSFRNFGNNRIFILLIIIQIVVGLFATYSSIDNLNKADYEKSKIENYFKSDRIYVLNFAHMLQETETETFSEIGEKINKTFSKIEKIQGINMFNNIFLTNIVKSEGSKYQNDNSEIMYLNKEVIEKYNIRLENGKILSKELLENNNIFLGQELKEIFNTGDKVYIEDKEFIVAGFLKGELVIPAMIDTYEIDFRNLNSVFLTSSENLSAAKLGLNKYTLNYFWFDKEVDNNTINNNLNIIEKDFDKIGLKPNISTVNSTINKLLEQYNNRFLLNLFVSILITIATFITFIVSILDSIERRLKEFGIYIFSGASTNNIIKIIFTEVFSVAFIAFNLFVLIRFWIFKTLNINYLVLLIIGLIVFIILTMIIPILKIKSIKIKDMINEVY